MKKWWIKQKHENDRVKPTHINNYTKRKCSKHSCQKIDADIESDKQGQVCSYKRNTLNTETCREWRKP